MWSDELLNLNPDWLMTVWMGRNTFNKPIEELLQTPIIPRISQSPMAGEEQDTPRICLAPTLKQCLEGITCNRLEKMADESEEIDWAIPITVFVFDPTLMDEDFLLTPAKLDEYNYVQDAYLSNEFWYLKSLIPIAVYKFYLSDILGEEGSWDILPRSLREKFNSAEEFYESTELEEYLNDPNYWATTFRYLVSYKLTLSDYIAHPNYPQFTATTFST